MELEIIDLASNELLEYGAVTKQFSLTLNAIKNIVGNAYASDDIAKMRSLLNSANVYSFIYNYGCSKNKKYTEFILNRTRQGKELLYTALMYQIIADAQNGYNDIVNQNPIDFGSGSIIDRRQIARNKVAVNVEELLLNSQAYLGGYNILSQVPCTIDIIDRILANEN